MNALLEKIARSNAGSLFKVGLIGLEKETLRVDQNGLIASTSHPDALGSALTHPHITTDYSEALLEFVTPPLSDSAQALSYLADVHTYVSRHLQNEHLWPASMPCRLKGESSIRIAEYGHSNLGLMKHVYRRGLGYRYGKTMQVISGVHVNLSIDESFWCVWQDLLGDNRPRQDFISEQYFVLIRNLQRIGWLVPYLFGSSPAIDRTFKHAGISKLSRFDDNTLYQPHATSLRLGDIGYTNHLENEIGVKACYDNLAAYVKCLTRAIQTPYEPYQAIGVKVGDEYRQLNANLLQIENEYYSSVRPKQPCYMNEKPTFALTRRGVAYVELRSLDLSPFEPLGVGAEQLQFIELLFLYCLIANSEVIDKKEREEIDINASLVAHRGREPGLELAFQGGSRPLSDWAMEVLDSILELADMIDEDGSSGEYSAVVRRQFDKIRYPEQTPSGKMLEWMRNKKLSYFELIEQWAQQYHKENLSRNLTEEKVVRFESMSRSSQLQQEALESVKDKSFDVFLQEYFTQSLSGQTHE